MTPPALPRETTTTLPDVARLNDRHGASAWKPLGGFEVGAEVLCAAKARWAELQRRASIMDSEIWSSAGKATPCYR